MTSLTLTELNIYPVKSLAGIALQRAQLDRTGLRFDRRWMVVDPSGLFMTQRRYPQMAWVQPRLEGDRLILSARGQGEIRLPDQYSKKTMKVRVWSDWVDGQHVGDDVDTWLSEVLGEACHLVWMPDDRMRQVDLDYAEQGDSTAFADGFPLLLISEASLADLNGRLAEPVSMQRFRPNLVVSGCSAFAEDHWSMIRVAEVDIRVVKPCSRCVLTTVNPATGVKSGPEPLQTLKSYRLQGGKAMFGQNLIPQGSAVLNIGDKVTAVQL